MDQADDTQKLTPRDDEDESRLYRRKHKHKHKRKKRSHYQSTEEHQHVEEPETGATTGPGRRLPQLTPHQDSVERSPGIKQRKSSSSSSPRKKSSSSSSPRKKSKKHKRPRSGDSELGYNPLGRLLKMERDKLAQLYAQHENSHVTDYVLCRPVDVEDSMKAKDLKRLQTFEKMMKEDGIELEDVTIDNTIFTKLHTTFKRLCKEAEEVKLELPLDNMEIYSDDDDDCCGSFQEYFKTDDEVDYVSAPFDMTKLHFFENHDKPDEFFRPALRSFLTHHILINIDIRLDDKKRFEFANRNQEFDAEEDDRLAKQGLSYLLHKGIYTDEFPLHEPSERDNLDDVKSMSPAIQQRLLKKVSAEGKDPRKDLDDTWPRICKFLPLWKIRNYFGEEIALYFAWSGTLVSTLLLPVLLGLAIFGYGLFLSVKDQYADPTTTAATTTIAGVTTTAITSTTTGSLDSLRSEASKLISVIKRSFDNEVTPWFALVICIWGTIFLELWKRKNAELAYEWDVDNFESSEPDRPQFYGTEVRKDPVTQEDIHHYPTSKKMFKYAVSVVFFLLMVGVVMAVTLAVIIYRVVLKVKYCTADSSGNSPWNGGTCIVVQTLGSTVLNAIAIMGLGKVYEMLVYKLTDWENHRTQTDYRDALIAKLFFFQFVNSYTSLFYIAFFRERYALFGTNGLAGLGPEYVDSCEGDCMSMLSLQVLVLIIAKPLPKFLKDVILPFVFKLWRNRSCCKKEDNKVEVEGAEAELTPHNAFILRENLKPPLQDFTLPEYTEKVIQYGYLMLFAVAMPLAPLIVFFTNLIDRYTDAKRMLWVYRRPCAYITQDIGMWFNILRFINICAVITNAFLIAYTSHWGQEVLHDPTVKLWFVLGFEHIILMIAYLIIIIFPDTPSRVKLAQRQHVVFGLRALIDVLIPDVPASVSLAIRREKYSIQKKMQGTLLKAYSLDAVAGAGNMMSNFSKAGESTTYKESMQREGPDGGSVPDITHPSESSKPRSRSGSSKVYPVLDSPQTASTSVSHANPAFQNAVHYAEMFGTLDDVFDPKTPEVLEPKSPDGQGRQYPLPTDDIKKCTRVQNQRREMMNKIYKRMKL